MTIPQKPLSEYVLSLLDEGHGREQIEIELLEKGHEQRFVKDLVKESIRLRQSKRMSQGLVLILAGALICFVSFLLTVTGTFSHDSFGWVLYGLTSVGIVVVFAGFMKIF